jgi:hypothetical protein
MVSNTDQMSAAPLVLNFCKTTPTRSKKANSCARADICEAMFT